jgi:hypothetical protein
MDKLLHFLVGIIIGMAVTLCTGNLLIGIAAALAGGLIKELWDFTSGEPFDFWDVFWTLIGGLAGGVFSWLCPTLAITVLPTLPIFN